LRAGGIKKLSKQTFATLPGLVNLDLSNNRIVEIETGAFDGLLNLRVLNLTDNKITVLILQCFNFNLFEGAVNKLGSPINLMSLFLDTESINSVRWSTETAMLVDEGTLNVKEKKKIEEDEAARLFAKCGFRNKLEITLRSRGIPDRSFVEALAARKLLRLFSLDIN
jgi:hypothetical protein